VIDGDTIECAEFIRHIRLEGIDTPEVGDQHGLIVKEVLETFILGKEVTFRYNHCDHYGRIVGTVYEGGDNINKAMLRCIYVKPFRWKDQSRNQQCEIE
jgi:endonuclease YncB( thermonuclease family)